MRAQALLFDKDGTLFGFQASWGSWIARMIDEFSGGDPQLAARLADALGYDLAEGAVKPDSVVIAATLAEVAGSIAPLLPHQEPTAIAARLDGSAAQVEMVPAVPLVQLLEQLAGMGLALGIATNDSEASARAHLRAAGTEDFFSFIAGYDSGHGAKPGPGMCQAFASHVTLPSASVAMIGDSLHDMHAGRAAGMQCVAVLTGVAGPDDLAPHADAVLPDIGHLPDWVTGGVARP